MPTIPLLGAARRRAAMAVANERRHIALILAFSPVRSLSPFISRGGAAIRRRQVYRRISLWALAAVAGTLFMVLGAIPSYSAASGDQGAMTTTKSMVDQALKILRDKQTPVVQRRRQLRDVLEPRF